MVIMFHLDIMDYGHNKWVVDICSWVESSWNPNNLFWISDHISYIMALRFGGHIQVLILVNKSQPLGIDFLLTILI